MRISDAWIASALAVAAVVVYLAFGWGVETSYDDYGRLAGALVAGRWWLSEAPPWLGDIIPCGLGRWCVVDPPLPAILSIPFLPLGTALAQTIASRLAGGASAGPLYLGLRCFGAPRPVALAGTVASALGTTLLFTSTDGRSPYAAHAAAMLFASVAFWLAARGGPAWGIGASIGLAALARAPLAAALPALALLAARRRGTRFTRSLVPVALGAAPFALVYVGWDVLRWGSVFDLGYAQLIQGNVLFSDGLLSPAYLPRQLYALLVQPPDLVERSLWFLRPRFAGMSLFLTTPAFLWVFAGLRGVARDGALAATALAAGCALLPTLFSGAIGQPQFGYRASLDAQPFLAALAITGDSRIAGVWRRRTSILFLVAVVLSIGVNAAGAIGILRFGWWQ